MEAIKFDVYLFFTGNCRQAMEFYKEVFGGELTIQTMGDMSGDKTDTNIMHAQLSGGMIELMASDGDRTEPYETSRISLSLGGKNEEMLRGLFEKLSAGGKVEAELKTESWGDTFGMVTDKFGIDWMINISK